MSENQTVRQRIIYHGRVQGVGFRATVASIAHEHPVRGYVRNLPDRTVELIAEAAASDLDRFREAIQTTMARYISDVTVSDAETSEPLRGFSVRF